MKIQYRVIETEHETLVYDLDEPAVPVCRANSVFEAVDFCYHAGENFEVELYEQILLDNELPFEEEE